MTTFDQIVGLWEHGQQRLRESEPAERAIQERVIDRLVVELRRRVGVTFTTEELTRYYLDQGTDWCFAIAIDMAPGVPAAWDMDTVAGTAFARYVRGARDYGGGLRHEQEEEE